MGVTRRRRPMRVEARGLASGGVSDLHQIGLERGEVLRHGDALLDTLHERLQLGRHLHRLAHDGLYHVEELGGMGRFEEYTRLARS